MKRKWILTKELFDSDVLKSQNEIPYLQGDLAKTYEPLGVERTNFNFLLLKCPYFMLCLGSNKKDIHYATYEDGVYLFIFVNDHHRVHIALDLRTKDSIGVAFLVYKLPIDFDHVNDNIILSYSEEGITMDEATSFLMHEGIEAFESFNFTNVVDYNHEVNLSRMN